MLLTKFAWPDASGSLQLQSVVGVAGGATRAALTQHQARNNNMADVSAKDGSQETLVNLVAFICSLLLLRVVTGNQLWAWFYIFAHLCALIVLKHWSHEVGLHWEVIAMRIVGFVWLTWSVSGSLESTGALTGSFMLCLIFETITQAIAVAITKLVF